MTCCKLHPGDHPSLSRHVEDTMAILKDLMLEQPMVITIDDGRMHFNTIPIPIDTQDAKRFFAKLGHKNVSKIIITKNVQAEEIRRFFMDLSSSGSSCNSYSSITVKGNDVKSRVEASPGKQTLRDDLFHVKRIYRDLSVFRSINMNRVDAITGIFLSNIRKGVSVQNMLVPMKSDSDNIYVHSINVALLSIFQAEHLGLGNALLHDIGLAALLHDVGKILLPKTILDRQDSLSDTEWAVMKKHTLYGAALLSSLNNAPDMTIIVAYEHHMKYDGTGYPEPRRRTKKQHINSQIVAISDFYCALSANLPHRKPLHDTAIISLLVEKAGKDFNPLLVDTFVQSLGEQGCASD